MDINSHAKWKQFWSWVNLIGCELHKPFKLIWIHSHLSISTLNCLRTRAQVLWSVRCGGYCCKFLCHWRMSLVRSATENIWASNYDMNRLVQKTSLPALVCLEWWQMIMLFLSIVFTVLWCYSILFAISQRSFNFWLKSLASYFQCPAALTHCMILFQHPLLLGRDSLLYSKPRQCMKGFLSFYTTILAASSTPPTPLFFFFR